MSTGEASVAATLVFAALFLAVRRLLPSASDKLTGG
jgi:hypothetical protein